MENLDFDFIIMIKNAFKGNALVSQKIDEYFSNFDRAIMEKFAIKKNNEQNKKDDLYLTFEKENTNFSIDYSPTTQSFQFKKQSTSFDKIDTKIDQLDFKVGLYQDNQLLRSPIIKNFDGFISSQNHILPELVISHKNDMQTEFALVNQSKSNTLATLSAKKNSQFLTFSIDKNNLFIVGEKNINQGKVEEIEPKRLNNKDFVFIQQKNYVFDCLESNYPQTKSYKKRFVINHKYQDQARLIEDFEITTPNNSAIEILKYHNGGSPKLLGAYANIVRSKNDIHFIKKVSDNPFEIMKEFGTETIVEVDNFSIKSILENPTIGEKIYVRKQKQLFNNMMDNYYGDKENTI